MILRTMIAASAVIGLATLAYAQKADQADGLRPGAKPMSQQELQEQVQRPSAKQSTEGKAPATVTPLSRAAMGSK